LISWIVLIAGAGLLQGLLEGVRFFLTAALIRVEIPVNALRVWLLFARALSALAISFWVFSFGLNPWISPVPVLFAAIGGELKSHLALRTTAAYSTSDGQNQRLFNVSVLAILVSVVIAAAMSALGANPFPSKIAFMLVRKAGHGFLILPLILGILFFLARAWLVATHFRTISYILSSYFNSWRQGKLKRFW
jgi:hypothetical protein